MKKKTSNHMSKNAASATLKRLFSGSDEDSRLLEEIFTAAGRVEADAERNRAWLSNKTTHLYYHNLVKPVYTYDDRKKLIALELTIDGKRALGRIEDSKSDDAIRANQGNPKEVSFADVAKIVKDFKQSNPEYDVVFKIELKEQSMDSK